MTSAPDNWVTHANKSNSEIPEKRTVLARGMIGFSRRDAENPIQTRKMQNASAAGNILEVVSRTWRSTSQSPRSANKILPPGRLALACCTEFLLDRSGEKSFDIWKCSFCGANCLMRAFSRVHRESN